MMAEYYALQSAMREVLPTRELAITVAKGLNVPSECLTTFKTTVWEDNVGALTLANLEPGQNTSRSTMLSGTGFDPTSRTGQNVSQNRSYGRHFRNYVK